MNIINEVEFFDSNDRSIEDLKKDFPNEIGEIQEALANYISENDRQILKEQFPDFWQYLNKKIAYPCDYFDSIEDSQKPINNLQKKTSSVY